jgi:hypothetical protein
MVLFVAVLQILRLVQAVQDWALLASLLSYLPVYLALGGLVWAGVGLPLAWGLWRNKGWALRSTGWALLAYSAYYWVDRLVLPSYPGRNSNWEFAAGMNLLILAWSFWTLSRQKQKVTLGEVYERKPEGAKTA